MVHRRQRTADARAASLAGTSRLALWFAVLGGMTAWAVHFWVSFALVEIVCRTTFGQFAVWGLNGLQLMLAIATVPFALITLAAAVVSWRVRESAGTIADPDSDRPRSLAAFMGTAGLLLSLFFLATIIVSVIPSFMLRGCA